MGRPKKNQENLGAGEHSNNEIEKLLELANKSFKCFTGLGDNPDTELKRISSGIEVFDKTIGGGLVRGRMHLFTGGFASGKTYISQKVIQSAQKEGGICVYIDAEKRFDPHWFSLVGCDISKLIVSRPNYGEQALDLAIFYLKQGVDVLVIDSLAALTPMAEDEASMEQQSYALQAKMLNKAWRKIGPVLDKTVLITINQQRHEIATVFNRGIQKTMPGGEGQYFHAAMMVDIRRGEWIKQDKQKVGHEINCVVTKCNFHPPFGQCIIPLRYDTGQIDDVSMIINLALDLDIIKKKGAWYYIEETEPKQGLEEVSQFYRDNPDKFKALKSVVFKTETEQPKEESNE
jgi:recombination protein RecA